MRARSAPLVLLFLVAVGGAALPPATGAHSQATGGLRLVPVAAGLQEPLYVTAPRSEPNRLYIVEKHGVIRVLVRGRLSPRPFLDIHSRVRKTRLLGLFSVAFHPAYASNRRFYVMYPGRRGNLYVVEFRTSRGRAVLRSGRVIFAPRRRRIRSRTSAGSSPSARIAVFTSD